MSVLVDVEAEAVMLDGWIWMRYADAFSQGRTPRMFASRRAALRARRSYGCGLWRCFSVVTV